MDVKVVSLRSFPFLSIGPLDKGTGSLRESERGRWCAGIGSGSGVERWGLEDS